MAADTDEADVGNIFFSVTADSLTTTDGDPLLSRLWAVPWSIAKAIGSSIWVLYSGCTFDGDSGAVCGIKHMDGITIGFTVVPEGSDKGLVAIIVLTVIASAVLIGLVGRYLYRKARKRQSFYRLFTALHLPTYATHTETELVPVRERDLDD